MNESATIKGVVRCENCAAYEVYAESHGASGICRRMPPQALGTPSKVITRSGQPDLHIASAWPPVPADSWCTQFIANEATIKVINEHKAAEATRQIDSTQ